MKLAVNYSTALADLVDRGQIKVDLYKCPAWPDLVARLTPVAEAHTPCYIHFPLLVGTGAGGPINTETNAAPDWGQIERLLERTDTPWVSAHMGPRPEDHPDLARLSFEDQTGAVEEILIRDFEPLIARFGPEHVVGENIFEFYGVHLRAAMLPEVISSVIATVGCGFLLDLSHARLAAGELGLDPRAYVETLPVKQLRELHITGIQRLDAFWVERLHAAGVDAATVEQLAGKRIDHLPMTDEDWGFLDWALNRIRSGAWREPEIVAFEVGGVGPMFEALTLPEVPESQVPRLYAMVHSQA